jgi:hypothetical protein
MKRFECKLTLVETSKYNLVIEAETVEDLDKRLHELLDKGRPQEGLYEFELRASDLEVKELILPVVVVRGRRGQPDREA